MIKGLKCTKKRASSLLSYYNTVLASLDDGYADNYTYALPVLEKYHIKANLMLSSGLVGSNNDMLTWSMVSAMKSSGLYYFTNHTWSHYPVNMGSQTKIEQEIDTAQTEIQQHTGQSVNIFTYPYGAFNNNAIKTLQKKGYVGAFSIDTISVMLRFLITEFNFP